MILDKIDKLPIEQLQRLMGWISSNDPAVEKEAWNKIAAGLRSRWDAEPDWQIKSQFGTLPVFDLTDTGDQFLEHGCRPLIESRLAQ